MAPSGAAELGAAAAGRAALEAYFASAEFDPEAFTPADHAALSGAWSWIGTVADQALETDQGGMADDDLTLVTPWGCDPGRQAPRPVRTRRPGPDQSQLTPRGWRSAAVRQNCGYAPATDTSRS
jgi:hypothetical protein